MRWKAGVGICLILCGCSGMPVNGLFGRQSHECRQALSLKEAAVQRQEEEIRELKARVASQELRISAMNATIQDQQQKLRGFGVF